MAIKDYVDQIVSFFSPLGDAIKKLIPQFFVAIGVGVFLLHYFFPESSIILTAVPFSLALLGGGFFAWLTKGVIYRKLLRDELAALLGAESSRNALKEAISSTLASEDFRGILSEEASKVVSDPAALMVRNDVDKVFINVTVAAGLPAAIANIACPVIMKQMWDSNRPYYYEWLERSHSFSIVDKRRGIVKITTKIKGLLRNALPDKAFTRTNFVNLDKKAKAHSVPKIVSSSTVSRKTNQHFSATVTQDPSNNLRYVYSAELPAESDFDIADVWEYDMHIRHDNVMTFETPVFVQSLRVGLSYGSNDLVVLCSTLGRELTLESITPLAGEAERLELNGLISPGNGYIVSVQRTY